MQADIHIFSLIRRHVGKSKSLDKLASWCAEYLGYLALALAGALALYFRHWQLFFVPLLAGFAARFVVNEIVYAFYRRKRPSTALGFTPLIKEPDYPSFPSGHTSFFFGFAFLLFAYSVPLAVVCVALAALMSLARVFCGVHWPSDILAGMAAAALASIIFWHFI